jgi:hypothetical protein
VSAENRLTTEQLAALVPGDVVTIESGSEFGRRRYVTATVARITARRVVITCGRYVECYSLRDGGIGRRAELVNTDVRENVTAEARRRNQTVDALYREWSRHRGDVALLQRLHDAIHQCLEHQSQPA